MLHHGHDDVLYMHIYIYIDIYTHPYIPINSVALSLSSHD